MHSPDDIDPLIKMPVIHYQFESIHPFYDGNGRTGRILNVLYLIASGKLEYPILFLSEYINKNRSEYYRLFSKTRDTGSYHDFIVYMLEGVILQASKTSQKIIEIHVLMERVEHRMSQMSFDYHKIVKILFSKPFLSVSEFSELIGYTRQTTTKYIQTLETEKIISSMRV